MHLLKKILTSSIGKKIIMAVTGAMLGLFLLGHLAGNTTAFMGRKILNAYAERLHSLGVLINIIEVILLVVFLTHVITAVILYFENLGARPARYAVNRTEPGQWLSKTVPYTGLLILVFLVVHLNNFHFASDTLTVADRLKNTLSRPGYAAFYIVSLAALILHLSHGFWSMFQTLGLNHPRYNSFLKNGALAAGVIIGTTYILIPVLALLYERFLY